MPQLSAAPDIAVYDETRAGAPTPTALPSATACVACLAAPHRRSSPAVLHVQGDRSTHPQATIHHTTQCRFPARHAILSSQGGGWPSLPAAHATHVPSPAGRSADSAAHSCSPRNLPASPQGCSRRPKQHALHLCKSRPPTTPAHQREPSPPRRPIAVLVVCCQLELLILLRLAAAAEQWVALCLLRGRRRLRGGEASPVRGVSSDP